VLAWKSHSGQLHPGVIWTIYLPWSRITADTEEAQATIPFNVLDEESQP
jgi:hypothetical protein